jgi:hypothetical protein
MQCPPGLILNKRTRRCVLPTGNVGKRLYAQGNVRNAEVQEAMAYSPYRAFYRAPKQVPTPFYQAPKPFYQPYQAPKLAPKPIEACKPGYVINRMTRRCIKIGGETYKKLYPEVRNLDSMSDSDRLIEGLSGPVPMEDRNSIITWLSKNCKYTKDPLTGKDLITYNLPELQNLVRLHDGSCTLAPRLNDRIVAEHKENKIATLPSGAHLTLGDFKALKQVMLRTVPGYSIPARRHIPPPPSWKLYIESDNRSGPEYITVLYYDITKSRMTATGKEYPLEGIRVDLGFLPIQSPLILLDLLKRLEKENKLLKPVAGGWEPLHGFPFTKADWSKDKDAKLLKLFRTLSQ